MMQLPRDGREYAILEGISGAPEGAEFEISFRQGSEDTEWAGMETVDETSARVLIEGPDAPEPVAGVALATGRAVARYRLSDTPEIVVRVAGVVDVA